ncbi:MAG TPA: GNAT family N-acetyltransferase [Casimicrobiaceae bacterium]|nr:GNAT family N-acetyltransferase [Casimicrobiaceae bacterium]
MDDTATRARSFVVRSATATDVPAIAAIYYHHVAHGTASFELAPPTVDDMLQHFETSERSDYPYFVAQKDSGRVVGYAYAGPYRARPAYRHAVENSVYVGANELGHGIGSALLAALIDECAARGYRQMIAIIGGADNEASIRLHARHGFAEVGRLQGVGHKFDRWLDTVLMQRALGPGATSPPSRL